MQAPASEARTEPEEDRQEHGQNTEGAATCEGDGGRSGPTLPSEINEMKSSLVVTKTTTPSFINEIIKSFAFGSNVAIAIISEHI